MERKIIVTKDGSHSIAVHGLDVTYHSIHGAIQESMHVFIEAGLKELSRSRSARPFNQSANGLSILEAGFGTGLNSLLTMIEADEISEQIHYTAVEIYPLAGDEIRQLNYCDQLNQPDYQTAFETMHRCEWEKDVSISPFFILHKTNADLTRFSTDRQFDIVYYDAFAPAAQPELWTKEIFERLYKMMNDGGRLVTYCSKGDVRRAMLSAGFKTEKLPGPRGKREMLRAIK